MTSSLFLFFSYHNDASSNKQRKILSKSQQSYVHLPCVVSQKQVPQHDVWFVAALLWDLKFSEMWHCVMVVRFRTAWLLKMKALPSFESPWPAHLTTRCHLISLYRWTAATPCSQNYISFNLFRFHWIRVSPVLGSSEVLITWNVGPDVLPAEYRIRHFGSYKYIFGGVYPYVGTTHPFKVSLNLPCVHSCIWISISLKMFSGLLYF